MSDKKFFLSKAQSKVDNIIEQLETLSSELEQEKYVASTPKRAQVRPRSGVLHVQYGSEGSYQKADVTVSKAVMRAVSADIQSGSFPTGKSFAGSANRYLVATFTPSYNGASSGKLYLTSIDESFGVSFS